MTIIRHLTSGAIGEVEAETHLSAAFVGDMAGPWLFVAFEDGLACWVQASSVEPIHNP